MKNAKSNKTQHIITTAAFAVMALSASACENTWHGAGRDMENMGEEMQSQYRDDHTTEFRRPVEYR
jgi:predicted small secreted protein